MGLSGCFCVRCDLADVFLFLRGEACQYFKGLARNYRRTACHDSLCDPAADRCVGTFGTGDRRGNHSDDPGVAFTNGIRDIVDGDYLSGCVRLLDAILVFCSIAIGVGLGLKL